MAQRTEANLAGLEGLVETALKLDPHDDRFHRAEFAKALLEYRKGNHQSAIEWAQKCQATVVLALSYASTGEDNKACQQMTALEMALRNQETLDRQVMGSGFAVEEPLSLILLKEVEQSLPNSTDEIDHPRQRAK